MTRSIAFAVVFVAWSAAAQAQNNFQQVAPITINTTVQAALDAANHAVSDATKASNRRAKRSMKDKDDRMAKGRNGSKAKVMREQIMVK